jgi:hypothetical protein
MSLWRRAPREVYRVYGEDQYREGEMAPEGEAAAQEDTTTTEPDGRGVASWRAFAAEASPASPGAASSSARPSASHTGRLVGVGLLMGVGLATLALVFLNMAHRHGAAPEPVGHGTRAESEQRGKRAAGGDRAHAIARSMDSSLVRASHFSAPPVRKTVRVSGSTLQHRAPAGGGADTAPRLERAWSTALRAPGEGAHGDGAPAMVAAETQAQVVVEPPVQDEFGFEQ